MNDPKLNKKKRMAVSYLIQAKDERPEGLEKFFNTLDKYEGLIRELISAIQEAEKSLNELYKRREQMFGSITSIVDMVIDELPDDKCIEWAEKCNIPATDPSMPGRGPVKQSPNVDMAGSTAKQSVTAQVPPGVKLEDLAAR